MTTPQKTVEELALEHAKLATQHLSASLGWNPYALARTSFESGHAAATESCKAEIEEKEDWIGKIERLNEERTKDCNELKSQLIAAQELIEIQKEKLATRQEHIDVLKNQIGHKDAVIKGDVANIKNIQAELAAKDTLLSQIKIVFSDQLKYFPNLEKALREDEEVSKG